jgi:hypothetical protein
MLPSGERQASAAASIETHSLSPCTPPQFLPALAVEVDRPVHYPQQDDGQQLEAWMKIEGPWFKDEAGRTLMLRGVNLGGSSKVPSIPNGATHIRQGFFDHRGASFVGRPFPLEEADEHFSRLQAWGLRFLRLLVPWEAVEHAGPGQYDDDYLAYLREIVARAREHGLQLFIDPHQDVWSRFSGGDGAPGWTFEAAGLDISSFRSTAAAIVHQTHGDPFPSMIWPSNSGKLAAATMFTLFFGGGTFAPGITIDGESIEGFLQRHYNHAFMKVAEALDGLDNVVGYETMNEPLAGYIGWTDLDQPGGIIQVGPTPSALQGMALGAGIPQSIPVIGLGLRGERVLRHETLNRERRSAWLEGHRPVWQAHGVWEVDHGGKPQLLRPDYFSTVNGQAVDFERDFYRPFAIRFARAIRSVDPAAIILLEGEPRRPELAWEPGDPSNIAYAPHWYDGLTLYLKRFSRWLAVDHDTGKLVLGPGRIETSFHEQLARRILTAADTLDGIPVLIGEFGIPFDLRHGRAYHTGSFRAQAAALDRSYRAIESNLLSSTLWNYTADNDNERGDQWNGEDLSIFSRDQQLDPSDINSGGRALSAVVRPYPICTAGEPLTLRFDRRRRTFSYTFKHDPLVSAPTEIYLPELHYPQAPRIWISDGTSDYDQRASLLRYHHDPGHEQHTIEIEPA